MASNKLLYEAGTKKVFEGDSEDHLILSFNDNLVTADGTDRGKIKGKAANNNSMSGQIFEYLESYNVMTHFISRLSDNEMQVKKLDNVPIGVVISNAAEKNLSKRFGFKEGSLLRAPVIEYYYKNDKLKNPLVNESHITALNLISQEEVHHFSRIVSKVNVILKSFFERRKMVLAEIHLVIGKYKGHLLVGDEISPDTCSFWGFDPEGNIDRNLYKFDKGNEEGVYQEIIKNINGEG